MALRSLAAWFHLALAGLLGGCTPELIGDEIGTYRVTMTLSENTCGAQAVHLQDGRQYRAQLRADGTRGYWRVPENGVIEGTFESGRFEFSFSGIADQSDADAGVFCQILQEDVLLGSVAMPDEDAGTSDAAVTGDDDDVQYALPKEGLIGRHTFELRAAEGTDCAAALTSAGGGFMRLPCSVRYDLKGTPSKSF